MNLEHISFWSSVNEFPVVRNTDLYSKYSYDCFFFNVESHFEGKSLSLVEQFHRSYSVISFSRMKPCVSDLFIVLGYKKRQERGSSWWLGAELADIYLEISLIFFAVTTLQVQVRLVQLNFSNLPHNSNPSRLKVDLDIFFHPIIEKKCLDFFSSDFWTYCCSILFYFSVFCFFVPNNRTVGPVSFSLIWNFSAFRPCGKQTYKDTKQQPKKTKLHSIIFLLLSVSFL